MKDIKKVCKAAFPLTIPILTGFLFLGFAFGVLMEENGFHIGWTMLLSLVTFAGSMQFLTVSLLSMDFAPFYVFCLALMVNARHLFYGISMLTKFKDTKSYKTFLIFTLCDETFSVLCSSEPPKGVDKTKFMCCISFLNYIYWVVGSFLGGVIGRYIHFDTQGIEFVLTALFVVIFINQWKELNHHYTLIIGVLCTLLSLLLVGPDKCIVSAMIMTVILLSILQKKKPLEEII